MNATIIKDLELTDRQIEALSGLITQAEEASKAGKPGMIILQPLIPTWRGVAGCFCEHETAKRLREVIRGA